MPARSPVDARLGRRIVLIVVHVAFMIVNAAALVSSVGQRALTDAGNWELVPGQFEGIMLMDRWGTFGRLTLLASRLSSGCRYRPVTSPSQAPTEQRFARCAQGS